MGLNLVLVYICYGEKISDLGDAMENGCIHLLKMEFIHIYTSNLEGL